MQENEQAGAVKMFYLVLKTYCRGTSMYRHFPVPHQAFTTRKEANAACKRLNEKASYFEYSVKGMKIQGPPA